MVDFNSNPHFDQTISDLYTTFNESFDIVSPQSTSLNASQHSNFHSRVQNILRNFIRVEVEPPLEILSPLPPSLHLIDLPLGSLKRIFRHVGGLGVLRQVCRYFHRIVFLSPFWVQTVPMCQMDSWGYELWCLGWDIPSVIHVSLKCCSNHDGNELVKVVKGVKHVILTEISVWMSRLRILKFPEHVETLDLSTCEGVGDEVIQFIPFTLFHVYLPWNNNFSGAGIERLVRSLDKRAKVT